MIIDLILDRKDGQPYEPKTFYDRVSGYSEVFDGIGDEICEAMDEGEEQDVRRALARYIVDNDYNPDIINYINSVQWLPQE